MNSNPTLLRYQELQTRLVRLQREMDKASGALMQALSQLQAEFGCVTLEEAETQLAKMQKKLQTLEQQYQAKLEEFENAWSTKLDGETQEMEKTTPEADREMGSRSSTGS